MPRAPDPTRRVSVDLDILDHEVLALNHATAAASSRRRPRRPADAWAHVGLETAELLGGSALSIAINVGAGTTVTARLAATHASRVVVPQGAPTRALHDPHLRHDDHSLFHARGLIGIPRLRRRRRRRG